MNRTRVGWGLGALAGALLAALSSPLLAQSRAGVAEYSAQDADEAFASLRSEVPGLHASWDFDTGFPRFIFGRPIEVLGAPHDDAEYEATARRFVDLYPGLFGFDSAVLVTDQVKHLEMESIGTTNKVAVGFSQWVGGLPVVDGTISFLFGSTGALVAIENNGLPNVARLVVAPSLSDRQATEIAVAAYGHSDAQVLGVEIAIVPDAGKRAGELAWIVEVGGAWDAQHNVPIQEKIQVDANTGAVIRSTTSIHTFTDLTGHTNQWATPGTTPDTTSNPIARFNLMRGDVKSAVGNAVTDTAGDWRITYSGSANQTITWSFSSSSVYAWVDDQGGADYTKSKVVTPGKKDFAGLNQVPNQYNTAEMNAQRCGVNFREWVVTLDPTETKMDFRQRLNVNQNSTCNAYYNGSSTNFYRKGGGCNNTAYTTVIAHETGHWANDVFSSGNGSDGFGEGAADTWAMYIYDTPIVGEDFYTNGGDIRDGRNTRKYCGKCAAGCYGEVHADGEVLMGAFWKVRDHLNTTLGDAPGDAVADSLWLRWFQGFNAKTICDTNETQILTLDDDNGNIDDGTPNSGDIEAGFEDQGYPGYY